MSVKSITVLGRQISYEIKDIDIYSIEYYDQNPRINYIISKFPKDKVTQDLIEQELLKLDSTKERIRDIEENKGMIDEIYVRNNQVVEGNTRLCAYRRLSKKYSDDEKWKQIKSRILPSDLTEEELFYILGIFHLKGKKEWDAYEKAAYINKMINVLNKRPEDICKQLGIHKKTLDSMLKSYEVMSKKYLNNSSEITNGSRDELKKFSYFNAFYTQKELSEKVEETPAFEDEFVNWVKEDRFKNAQCVRELPKIINNKKAFKLFTETEPENAYEEAIHVLYEHKPEKVDRFYKKIREFRELLKESEVLKVKEEVSINRNKKNEIQQCYRDLKKFCNEIGLDIKQ